MKGHGKLIQEVELALLNLEEYLRSIKVDEGILNIKDAQDNLIYLDGYLTGYFDGCEKNAGNQVSCVSLKS